MKKSQTPKTVGEKKVRKPRKVLVFDQDNGWKDYMSTDIFACLAVTHPKLYAAIDKTVPPHFLEQEMSNAMRGKYKIYGKDRKADKLVKLRLLSGEDCFIYVHFEVQDQLQLSFPERIYIYRSLISLKYNTQKITTIVIFTGKAPEAKHKVFRDECFGSEIMYRYNSYVIVNQDEEELKKSDNPFHLAVLAAKYTLDTEGDARKRLVFKRKLTELAFEKKLSQDKLDKLLSFVFDYMLLPDDLENEYLLETPILSSENPNTMVATERRLNLIEVATRASYGKSYQEMVAENAALLEAEKAKAAKVLANEKAEAARKEAEAARKEAEATRKEAEATRKEAEATRKEAEATKLLAEKEAEATRLLAEKEVERKKAVISLLNLNFSVEKIAEVLDYDLDFVKKIAVEKLENDGKSIR